METVEKIAGGYTLAAICPNLAGYPTSAEGVAICYLLGTLCCACPLFNTCTHRLDIEYNACMFGSSSDEVCVLECVRDCSGV